MNTRENGPISRLIDCFQICHKDNNDLRILENQKDFFTQKFSVEDEDSKMFYELCHKIILIVDGNKDTFKSLMHNYERGKDLLYYVYKVFTGDFQYMLSTLMYIIDVVVPEMELDLQDNQIELPSKG